MPEGKLQTFTVESGSIRLRSIVGAANYWANGVDVVGATSLIDENTGSPSSIVLENSKSGGFGRLIWEVDLDDFPINARVLSAELHWEMGVHHDCDDSVFPIPLSIYRVNKTVDMTAADFENYQAGLPWEEFGMKDEEDYSREITGPALQASDQESDAVFTYAWGKFWEIDITEFMRHAQATDSRTVQFVMTRADYHLTQYPDLGTWIEPSPTVGKVYPEIAVRTGDNQRPRIDIYWIDILSVHPSDENGDIDESIIIDTSTDGLLNFAPVRVGANGPGVKLWVKNQLAEIVNNIEIFSQHDHMSKDFEITRNAVGDGTVTNFATIAKSAGGANYTRDERWKLEFLTPTTYEVYRDNGTLDDPSVTDTWYAANPTTGVVGTLYTETDRGVTFKVNAGATAFVAADQIFFRSYGDDAHENSPATSDLVLEIAADASGSPGTYQEGRSRGTLVSGNHINETEISVDDASDFAVGNQVRFTERDTGQTHDRTLTAVDTGANTITFVTTLTIDDDDYVELIRVGVGSLEGGSTLPFWVRIAPATGTTTEVKYPRWRVQGD